MEQEQTIPADQFNKPVVIPKLLSIEEASSNTAFTIKFAEIDAPFPIIIEESIQPNSS